MGERLVRWFSSAIGLYALILLLLALLPPLLAKIHHYELFDAVMALFVGNCHQQALRSFWVLGYPLAVCCRCLGIYAGVALGCYHTVFKPSTFKKEWLVLLVIGIMEKVLEFFITLPLNLAWIGNTSRFIAGFWIAFVSYLLFVNGIKRIFQWVFQLSIFKRFC
ncbi:MAG: DUF2085 domain-containing protein [Vampirovibrio sp.]|nr:DUF2085 domain-containing protein [Vampirovibrio sp.]